MGTSICESGLGSTIFGSVVLSDRSTTGEGRVADAGNGSWGLVSRTDKGRLMVADPYTPEATDRNFEIVRNPSPRGRGLDLEWRCHRR